MAHAPATKIALLFAFLSVFLPTTPSLHAQSDQWEKHMKSGTKAYDDGMKQKYFHGWGNAAPNPQFAKAEEEFLAALAQIDSLPPGDMSRARTLGALATVYMEEGKFADAEARGTQAIALMDASAKPDDPRLGYALVYVALIYDSQGKTDQAAPLYARSLSILKNSGGADPQEMSNLKFHADFLRMYQPAASAQIYQYILDLSESTGVSDKDLRSELGRLAQTQRGADAEQDCLRILELDKKLFGPDDVKTAGDQEALAKLYLAEGKFAAALPLLQHSQQVMQAKPAPEHESRLDKRFDASDALHLNQELAQAYAGAGKNPEAEEIYKRIISSEESDTKHEKVLNEMSMTDDLRGLAGVYLAEHRYDDALETMKRTAAADDEIENSKFGKVKGLSGTSSVWVWMAQIELAEIYREKGDSAAAEPLFQQSLAMTQQMHLAPGHPKLAQMLGNYATLLRDQGKYPEAEALYKRSLEVWAKTIYPENADDAETLTNYAQLLRKTNRPTEAEPLEARASAMLAKVAAPNPAN